MSTGWHASTTHSSMVVLTSMLHSNSFSFTFVETSAQPLKLAGWTHKDCQFLKKSECSSVAFSRNRAWSHFGSAIRVEGTVSCLELVIVCPSYKLFVTEPSPEWNRVDRRLLLLGKFKSFGAKIAYQDTIQGSNYTNRTNRTDRVLTCKFSFVFSLKVGFQWGPSFHGLAANAAVN